MEVRFRILNTLFQLDVGSFQLLDILLPIFIDGRKGIGLI